MKLKIIATIMMLVGFFMPILEAQIALTPKGYEAVPDSLWGKPIIINPGTWQHGFNPGCGGDGNDCGKWDRFTIQVQPYTPPVVTPPPPPPVVKEPILVVQEEVICIHDSIRIKGTWYNKPGTFVKKSLDTNLIVVITMNPQPRTDTTATIMEGDSLLFGDKWLKVPGTYRDTLKCIIGCDSIVTLYLHVLPDCRPCKAERLKWLALGRLSLSAFLMKEEHNDWQNRVLGGISLNYEYRLKDGLLFNPVKHPCIGEAIVASVALRGANDAPPTSDCITCNNLPDNAPVTIEARAAYKLSWLKGYPLIPSISAGPAVSWNQGSNPAVKWGFVVTPEVEWIVLQKKDLPTISAFTQANLSLGTMPSDWRVGFRLYIGGKKK